MTTMAVAISLPVVETVLASPGKIAAVVRPTAVVPAKRAAAECAKNAARALTAAETSAVLVFVVRKVRYAGIAFVTCRPVLCLERKS